MQSSIELVGYSYTNALLVQMHIHTTHTSIFGDDISLVPRPHGRREKWPGIYPLFVHVRTILEIFYELVQLWTSYTWLLCGEIPKLDIWLAVWQLSCVYVAMASIIRDTRGDTTRTTLQPPPVPPSLCL